MPMSEMSALQRRVETLEDELRSVLRRLDQLESHSTEEDIKVCRLEREVQHEHAVLDRIEHRIPVGI